MKYVFIATLLLQTLSIFSQNTLKGTVMFEGNQPLEGAHVYWRNTEIGTYTKADGTFELPKNAASQILVVSYVGFVTEIREIHNENSISVMLTFDLALDAVEIEKVRRSLSRSGLSAANVQTMSSKELLKAACCNLSESFETNPSIDVNFSDAVSGNRQIRMLGLTSPYILMTDENIPTLRGVSQSYGLSFVPGTWVESIQITKGAGSVINGYESISGQINFEYLKPLHDNKLFVNTYASTDQRLEWNSHHNHKFSEKLATTFFLHGNTRVGVNDMNNDGFLDIPIGRQINFLNRWQYQDAETGWIAFLNARALTDEKQMGQTNFNPRYHRGSSEIWGSELNTRKVDLSAKVGRVSKDIPWRSFGLQQSFSYHQQDAYFRLQTYDVIQRNYYANALYNTIISNTSHKLALGMSFANDHFSEFVNGSDFSRVDTSVGAFGEYNFCNSDDLSYTLGMRVDSHNRLGVFVTPRMHVRYKAFDHTNIRFSAGRGRRAANIFAENMPLFASSRIWNIQNAGGTVYGLDPETAWNYGFSLAQHIKIGGRDAEFGVDFYRTDFVNQVVIDVDASPQQIQIYNLQGKSFANSLQVDFTYDVFKNFQLRTAYKYYDVRTDFSQSVGLIQRALQPRHRLFANLEYATSVTEKGKQWRFDYTFNQTGRQRLPDTSSNPEGSRLMEFAPAFLVMNSQVTRVFSSRFEVYVGGENIGNYRQPNPILGLDNPFGPTFDSSMVYGPIFGAMYYAGLRFTLN